MLFTVPTPRLAAIVSAAAFLSTVAGAHASTPGANGPLVISAATQAGSPECGDAAGPPRVIAHVADTLCAERSPVPYAMYFAGPDRQLQRWWLSGGGYQMGTLAAGGRQAVLYRGAVFALYLAPLRPGARPIPLRRYGAEPAGSVDGRQVAYRRGRLWGKPGPPGGIYVAPTGGGAARFVGDGANPRWSSTGRLAYDAVEGDGTSWRGAGVVVTGTGGRRPQRIAPSAPGEQLLLQDWSPDGRELLVIRSLRRDETASETRSALYAMRPDGTGVRRLTSFTTGPEATFCLDAVWSPDGRRVAFLRGDGGGGTVLFTAPARARLPLGPRSWRRVLVGADALHDWAPRAR